MRGVADGLSLPPCRLFLGAVGRLLLLGEVVLVLIVRAVLYLAKSGWTSYVLEPHD